MKVEDLMVGDWVHLISTIHNVSFPDNGVIQDEGYTTIRTPIKITTVSENCVSYYSNKLEVYITVSSEEIEPIPLTPEILEKNGLYRSEIPTRDEIGHYYHRKIAPSSIFVSMSFEDGRDFGNQIKYVHQLQHALKLCEIDKEIVV